MAGHRSKNGHRSGCDQCYKFYIFFILGLLRPSSCLRRGFFYLRNRSVVTPDYIAIGLLIVLLVWAVADQFPRGKL
jgi:hypothetical protein